MEEKRKSTNQGEETSALPVVARHAAGIDVGSREHWVAVPAGSDEEHVRPFGGTTKQLHELADWLTCCGITTVAMEATGVYWVPLYQLLEERGFDVCLVNARHVRHVPGRKSDVRDCQWIQQLHSYGLLRASFQPTRPILELRTYLRHRKNLVKARASLVQQMQKALTLMNLKLDRVIKDVTGLTGMRIIKDIVAGVHDPEKLAEHRDPRCRVSHRELVEALCGEYRADLLFTLSHALELYESYEGKIADSDAKIQKQVDELAEQMPDLPPPPAAKKVRRDRKQDPKFDLHAALYRLTGGVDIYEVTGISELAAVQLISEIGTDMSRWKTAKHFVSWTTLAPGCRITGGKRYSGKRPASAHRVAELLRMSAVAAGRTQSAIGGFYRRLSARIGKMKAVVATAAKLARIIYGMLKNGTHYADPGQGTYEQRYRSRLVRNLKRRAKELGFTLTPLKIIEESGHVS